MAVCERLPDGAGAQVQVFALSDAHEQIDHAMATAVRAPCCRQPRMGACGSTIRVPDARARQPRLRHQALRAGARAEAVLHQHLLQPGGAAAPQLCQRARALQHHAAPHQRGTPPAGSLGRQARCSACACWKHFDQL